MNSALRTILVALAPFVVMYAITTFIMWEPHPGEWHVMVRYLYATLSAMASVGLLLSDSKV